MNEKRKKMPMYCFAFCLIIIMLTLVLLTGLLSSGSIEGMVVTEFLIDETEVSCFFPNNRFRGK